MLTSLKIFARLRNIKFWPFISEVVLNKVIFFVSLLVSFLTLGASQAQDSQMQNIEQRLDALEKSNSESRTQVQGQIQFNTAFYQTDDDIKASERPNLEGGSHFRRVRYDMRGKLDSKFGYRLQLDFAGEAISFKNVHIDYELSNARIKLGNTKVAQSHEYMKSSSNIYFIERSLMNESFKVGRKSGLEIQGHVNKRFTYHTGVYTEALGSRDSDERAPVYSAVRLTGLPFDNGSNLLHIGGHFIHSTAEEGPRFRGGPESRVSRIRPMDTGSLSDAHKVHRYGAELITLVSNWRLNYEYLGVSVQDRDVSFGAHMVEAAANLTGEKRKYSRSSGMVKGLDPINPWSSGGLGAFELAFRASWADLNDSPTPAQAVNGGKGLAIAANLAWLPVKDILFSAEVGQVDLEQVSGLADQKIEHLQLKAQVMF